MWFLPVVLLVQASQAGPDPAAVQKALTSKDCKGALSQAEQGALAAPTNPVWQRLIGDSKRCMGNNREAVLAWRRAVALGDKDPALARQVATLAATLGSLDVRLNNLDGANPPALRLVGADLKVEPYEVVAGVARFRDLPPGYPLQLQVEGRGYLPTQHPIPAQAPGVTGTAVADLDCRGVGTLRLEAWDEGYTISVRDPVTTFNDVKPGELKVTAGALTFTIAGPTGQRVTSDEVGRDETLGMDLSAFLPSQVNLVHVPAGSSISWSGGPGSFGGHLDVGWANATTDPETGVPLLPDVPLQGLSDGTWTLEVDNPWLGSFSTTFVASVGSTSPAPVPWQSAPGLPAVKSAWLKHHADLEAPVDRRPHPALAGVGFGVGAVGLATAAMGLVKAGAAMDEGDSFTSEYQAALDGGDPLAAGKLFDDRQAAWDSAVQWRQVGAVGGGLALSGVAFAVLEIRLGARHEKKSVGPWSFKDLPPHVPASVPAGGVR